MKLFQQLLVAPAALGLLAPLAANAAELNINGVSDYSASSEEVKSISQFSDVYPTDWAYQALTELADRHGCVAGKPSGNLTRYEAAALLNSCLGNIAQVNEEERRLINEFAPELAVIKGRVDGLEARVGEFEAGQFSTTTKLKGTVNFVVGAADYDESDNKDALTFNYSYTANLNTSFSGDDLLYTRIKTGNFSDSQFDEKPGAYLASANSNDDTLKVDKLWYQFPVGDNLKVWLGAKIENYYMLASAPSIYKPVLKGFALGGNAATYGASTGQGFGAAWTQSAEPGDARFALSANYTASDSTGEKSDPTSGGIMTDGSEGMFLTKVEYGSPRWQVSAAYSHKTNGSDAGSYYSTTAGKTWTGNADSFGMRAYWRPESTGAIPSISAGYDITSVDDDGVAGSTENTASWMVGLSWKDVFVDGNNAGIAIGQRQYATETVGTADDPADDNFNWEAYYTFKVSDNVSVTPALFGVSDPAGSDDDVFGGLVQTTFRF